MLNSGYFQNLRARQALISRSGNSLFADALISTGGAVFDAAYCASDRSVSIESISVGGHTKLRDAITRAGAATLWIPHSGAPPNEIIFSRFLAKVGLEIMAKRALGMPSFQDWILDPQLDAVRRWARFGDGTASWPFHRRRIYPEEKLFGALEEQGGYQVLHEFDLLVTDASEIYAVICIFGEEFVINLGGPDLEGYHIWLKAHGGQSPLYTGKNASVGDPEPR